MEENKRKCECLRGVNCDVRNCVYHDGENKCTASGITVGPSYASTGRDTACVTFKPASDCSGKDGCAI